MRKYLCNFRAKIALNDVIFMICYIVPLDNGVTITPKRWLLSFVFAVICLSKSLLIQTFNWTLFSSGRSQARFACDVSVNLSQRKGSLMDLTIP